MCVNIVYVIVLWLFGTVIYLLEYIKISLIMSIVLFFLLNCLIEHYGVLPKKYKKLNNFSFHFFSSLPFYFKRNIKISNSYNFITSNETIFIAIHSRVVMTKSLNNV